MARFCDTSPCSQLLSALGQWIFGLRPPQQGYVAFLATKDGRVESITIDYCPFCGTRFGWTDGDQLEKWILPLRRKTKTPTQIAFLPYRELLALEPISLQPA
jgi:hypothetical protein